MKAIFHIIIGESRVACLSFSQHNIMTGMARKYIIGIDEVGRGPLAGPVTVVALALPRALRIKNNELGELKDSKKLSAKRREKWETIVINNPTIFYETASVYPKMIDRINISKAANLAATRAVTKLISNYQFLISNLRIYLDGGLYLNQRSLNARTIVRGDEKFTCIKLASIMAKVKRDRAMKRNNKKYPAYGFDDHKGYGTKKHILALKKHGMSPIHRKTFLKFL